MNPDEDRNEAGAGARPPELAELSAALRALHAPPVDETELRRVFRTRRRALAAAPAVAARRRRKRGYAAIAAVLVLAAVGGLARFVAREPPRAAAARPEVPAAVAAFQPLLYAPELVPGAAYSVVRVRIALSSLTLLPAAGTDGMIEADLLVGEDGLARGIRFDGSRALLVSQSSQ